MQADGTSGGSRTFSLSGISLHNLTRLLRAASGGGGPHLYFDEEDEEDDDNDAIYEDDDDWGYEIRAPGRPPWFEEVKEPVKEGVELLYSGDFGRIGPKSRSQRKTANIARHVLAQSHKAVPAPSREELVCVSIHHSHLWLGCVTVAPLTGYDSEF